MAVMRWLDRFASRGPASDPEALGSARPGDQVQAGGETWSVTAVLFYKDAGSEWPVVKIERGVDSAWLALEEGQVVRYDHLDLPVGPDGRASWNGRIYARAEIGTATVSRVMGSADAAPGEGLSYQVLRCPEDDRTWLSVETWNSGFTEVSAGRLWPVDRIVTGAGDR
jgi:uncharacterized protein DUF4178